MTKKRFATAKEWDAIRALYLRGENIDYIVEQFPYLRITNATIRNRMSKEGLSAVKNEIQSKAVDHMAQLAYNDKQRVNETCIKLFNSGAEVVADLLENCKAEISDGTIEKGKARATAYNVDLLMSGVTKIQKGLRVAYGMDEDGKLFEKEPEVLTIEGMKLEDI